MFVKKMAASAGLSSMASRVFNTPLLVHEAKLKTIASIMMQKNGFDLDHEFHLMEDDNFLSSHPAPLTNDDQSIAMISVVGTLVHRGGYLDAHSGLVSYQSLRAQIEEQLMDSRIKAIVLDIDSGGGEAQGCFEFCEFLAEAKTMKPVYAYVNEHAYSGAYAIASACTGIYVPKSGGVGSIGVVSVHLDQSAANEKAGHKLTPIIAGDTKIDGWSHGPLSERAHATLQSNVNNLYDIFTELVAKNRSLTVEVVKATEAQCPMAHDALEMGLVDGVMSFDSFIQELIETISMDSGDSSRIKSKAKKGDDNMLNKFGLGKKSGMKAEKPETPDEEKDLENEDEKDVSVFEDQEDETENSPVEDENSQDDEEKSEDESDEDGEKASVNTSLAVIDACILAGEDIHVARDYVSKGMSVESVQQTLVQNRLSENKRDQQTIKSASVNTGVSTMEKLVAQKYQSK
jgi:signal peptide peptidase SppA